MTSSNRSWISSTSSAGSSPSRDQDDDHDDCQSMDSFQRDQNTTNTSMNSKNTNRSQSSRGGDRYNHYRRDAPTRVKPWMRDKAVGGPNRSTSDTTTGNRVSRFRAAGSSARHHSTNGSLGGASMSVGSNSCANSVCSTSSFPEQQQQPLPLEVHQLGQVQVLSSNQSLLDDTSGMGIQFTEEASQSSRSGATDQAVRPQQDGEPSHDDHEKEGPSSVRSDQNSHNDDTTVNTEGESTAETPEAESDETPQQQQAATDENLENDDENAPEIADQQQNEDGPVETTSYHQSIDNTAATSNTVLDEKKWDDDDDSVVAPPKEEVYDVLPSVQPSSYNPMAAAVPSQQQQRDQPVSVAAYAALNKPTPLVAAQAALLNDAIVEEEASSESEEEASVEEPTEPMKTENVDRQGELTNVGTDLNQSLLDYSRDESFTSQISQLENLEEDTSPIGVDNVDENEAIVSTATSVTPLMPPPTELASSVSNDTLEEMNRMRVEIRRLEQVRNCSDGREYIEVPRAYLTALSSSPHLIGTISPTPNYWRISS